MDFAQRHELDATWAVRVELDAERRRALLVGRRPNAQVALDAVTQVRRDRRDLRGRLERGLGVRLCGRGRRRADPVTDADPAVALGVRARRLRVALLVPLVD